MLDEDDFTQGDEHTNTLKSVKISLYNKYALLILAAILIFLLTIQSLLTVGAFSVRWEFGFFVDALFDFFPLTHYFTNTNIPTIQFVDFRQYYKFILDKELIFSHEAFNLLLSDPFKLLASSEYGIFSIFGEAGVTLAIGFAGTLLGFPFALLFGISGAQRVTTYPYNFIFRSLMAVIRAIPTLVWALILIPLAGIGPTTAMLAVGIGTIGNLGRLFTDELEEIESTTIEGITSTGASYSQTVVFGMLTQVVRQYLAWTFYIFEINVRTAVSLGIIGAGGLGEVLVIEQGLFRFTNVMATLICILILVILVELLSQKIRSYIRPSEETRGIIELISKAPKRLIKSTFQ